MKQKKNSQESESMVSFYLKIQTERNFMIKADTRK